MTSAPFDRRAHRLHRDRAAAQFDAHAFLFEEVADRLVERLEDLNRKFPVALALGDRTGLVRRCLNGRGGVEALISADLSPAMAARVGGSALAADEEFLPFKDGSLDLVIAPMSLHWVNDLPGAMIQIRRALKPDGLFLGAVLGGETLGALRAALIEAESEETGGSHPRVSPVMDVRDLGMLMQRAGFALPVVDSDILTASYPDAFALMRDLRGMAETNSVALRQKSFTRRAVLGRAAATLPTDAQGRVTAVFHVLFATGWAPHESQQKPLRPGSAKSRLADALRVTENPLPREER